MIADYFDQLFRLLACGPVQLRVLAGAISGRGLRRDHDRVSRTVRERCGGTQFHDLNTDPAHCGACGHACAVTEECVGGVCTVPPGGCPPGADLCLGGPATACGDVPGCLCSATTDGGTRCGLVSFAAVCGECRTDADCTFLGLDAFCVKTVLPCCGLEASNFCRLPCPEAPLPNGGRHASRSGDV